MKQFSFENKPFQSILSATGINTEGKMGNLITAALYVSICWVPLAVYCLVHGSFWTGNLKTSFITHFDTQARLLMALPILILVQKKVSGRLGKILDQFTESELIIKEDQLSFQNIVDRNVYYIRSRWINIGLLIICYLQVYLVLGFETNFASMFSWQTIEENGILQFNFAGKWNAWVSKPLMLFILYRWLLSIFIWGNILRKISNLKLNLYAVHPDQIGGLGFLGFSLSFFSPVAFAISVVVAGHYGDYLLHAGMHLADLKITFAVYMIFITLLFSLPLMSFSKPLRKAREEAIFTYYDLAAGMNRELVKTIADKSYKVGPEDLELPHYSTVCDFNSLMLNVVQMKSTPFTLKDLIPLWVPALIPFIPVILIEIPVVQLLKTLSGLLL